MSLDISPKTEARLAEEAQRQGISVDVLPERLINESGVSASLSGGDLPELPVLNLGPMGPLHRWEIYDDIPCWSQQWP